MWKQSHQRTLSEEDEGYLGRGGEGREGRGGEGRGGKEKSKKVYEHVCIAENVCQAHVVTCRHTINYYCSWPELPHHSQLEDWLQTR